jgi:hypothetical protein
MRKLFLALALVAALPACQTIHNVDQAQVRGLAERLHAVNDGLAKQIDES